MGSLWAILLMLTAVYSVLAYESTVPCGAPLGMESGHIPDKDISASSSFNDGNVGPQNGRMRTEKNSGAWCPKDQVTADAREWIQLDLRKTHLVTASGTQGRFGNGQGQEFAEAYLLEYWRPKLGKWVRYRDFNGEEVITGNTNTYLESKKELEPPFWASKVRFFPYSFYPRTVCMRVELYGCYRNDGIISYSMPQGDKRSSGREMFDVTYDGHWDKELRRGLGLLTDGRFPNEDIPVGVVSSGNGNGFGMGWVGWKNDSRSGFVDITFEFDTVREFTAVHIYCSNQFTKEVQVFSEANVLFSVGGKIFPGEPITYSYVEDRIFETSRNVSIKLHHRIGKYVRLRLTFANKWIMISEIIFDSDPAHGNFTVEANPPAPGKEPRGEGEPVSTAKHQDSTYMTIVIVVLLAVIVLGVAMFFIINRHRHRKCFASPLTSKVTLPSTPIPPCHTAATDKTNISYRIDDLDQYHTDSRCGDMSTLPVPLINKVNDVKMDDYREPYQALKYAPYNSYSSVVMEMRDMGADEYMSDGSNYDYAVPEIAASLLPAPPPPPAPMLTALSDRESQHSGRSSTTKSPCHSEILASLKRRLEQTAVAEFPRHRLRMLSKLSEGAFGTVYIAEADRIPEYGTNTCQEKRLVAVKFLTLDASEQQKEEFRKDVCTLAALEDQRLARVLGVCRSNGPGESLGAIWEYLEPGDLKNFLRTSGSELDQPTLLYLAEQIAAGMKYLESLNFVHRDLAARNCLIGQAYQIKISDLATDNETHAEDYFRVDGNIPLPVRWMAWESVFLGKYTTKSDVWSFAVTLQEILTCCRYPPYENMSDPQVLENLAHVRRDDGRFQALMRPPLCPKDIYDMMRECWRRDGRQRPAFTEIHLFLQRKNLGYVPS